MKAGVAVMIELARARVPGRYLFFTREEIPVSESPLPALFDSGPATCYERLRDHKIAFESGGSCAKHRGDGRPARWTW